MKYYIKGGEVGTPTTWNIVDVETDEVITSLHGPMSATVAMLACEQMNKPNFQNNWIGRLDALML